MENGAHISSFMTTFSSSTTQGDRSSVRILIRSGASLDGSTRVNEELSLSRAEFLKGYLSDILHLPDDSFEIHSVGEDWENLYKALEEMDVPWAADAQDIIRHPSVRVKNEEGEMVSVDPRKYRLKHLADGEAWEVLKKTVFPKACAVAEVTAFLPDGTNINNETLAQQAPVPEPQQPTPEPEQAVPEPQQPTTESQHPATEPQQPEPVQPLTIPVTTLPTPAPLQSAPAPQTGPGASRRLADYLRGREDAEFPATTLEIQFRLNHTDIDLDILGNRERLMQFMKEFYQYYAFVDPAVIQIDIYAGASPEGPADHNRYLGEGRCSAIRNLLIDALGARAGNIVTHNLAARWDDFYAAVAASGEPWKDEVLAIIRLKPSDDGSVRDHREAKLRELWEGSVWPELLNGYLAPLRSGGSAVVSIRKPQPEPVPERPAPLGVAPIKDTIFLTADKEQARNNCVPIPLRRSAADAGCPTRIALSPEYLSTLSALMRDTLNIRFRLDSTSVDLDFAGNRYRVKRFLASFARRFEGLDPSIMKLDIYSGASPEGPAEHNEWLGYERGVSIRRLISDSLGIHVSNIQIHNQAARWDEFYDAIAASDEPWKEEVLAIIKEEPSRDIRSRDHREVELRALQDGSVWPVLLRKYLSPLRSGSSAQISLNPQIDPSLLFGQKGRSCDEEKGWQFTGDTLWICGGNAAPAQKDTVVIMQNTPFGMYPYDNYPWDNLPEGYYFDSKGYLRQKHVKKVLVPADKTPAWAVKTNLLFWGVVAPNISIEIPIGKWNRWSLEWEYDHPWYIWNNNSHASQILNMSLEIRLYLGNRDYHRWLDGWHLGLAIGGGKYDWEWKQHEGWQGEFINPYFNIGYQHRWGKHWAVDAGLGLGVIPSRYRHYYGGSVYPDNHLEPSDIHLIWHDTGNFFYPGLTHVNVSISYMFNNWPFRMRTMSERKRQEFSETWDGRMNKKREERYRKERERTERANARDEAREKREAAREAARQAKRTQKK